MPPPKKRIDDIEVLRGVAVLAIMLHHAQHHLLPGRLPLLGLFFDYFSGTGSVDLFFAISGFVITRNINSRMGNCTDRRSFFVAAISFWIRRAWRLLPSAWICLASILVASLVFNTSGAFGAFRANFSGVLSAVLQIANFHFAYNFDEIGGLDLGATFHFWTLSLEEQFYLLLPFVVYFSGRRLGWVVSALLILQLTSNRPSIFYWVFRTDAMMFGVLIALWSQLESYKLFAPMFLGKSRVARFAFLWGITIAIAAIGADPLRVMEYKVSGFSVLAALLVLAASYDENYLMLPGLPKRFLTWSGTRSYGLYLWHIPLFCATREIWARIAAAYGITVDENLTGAFFLTAAVLLGVIAELNFRFVEVPLRERGAVIAKEWEINATSANA